MAKKYNAFISHNSQDKPLVEQIAQWLEDKANLSVWIDKWNLVPGEPWQEEIEIALDESECCVVFLGLNGIGSWQNEEMRIALEKRVSKKILRVVPVLLPGAIRPEKESHLPGFLRRLTWVVFQESWEEDDALHRLVCGIKGIPPKRYAKKVQIDICPYRGLEVFREEDHRFFYGRDALVQRLMNIFNNSYFLAVLGPSGSGKSSIVQAGLIPHLKKNAIVTLFTPQERPIEELAFALRSCYIGNQKPLVEELISRLKKSSENFHYISREILENTDKKNLVIIIDQFEELFTQTRSERERRKFISALLQAVEIINGPTKVIIIIRSDFVGKCAFYPDLNIYVSDHFFQVEPMSVDELRSAIEEPARLVGINFEKGLLKRILNDVIGAPGELPLLGHALLELYKLRKGNQLTSDAYDEIGGIEGALIKRADSEFSKLDVVQKKILHKMFVMRLIHPGEGTEDTRRRATKDELLAIGSDSSAAEVVLNKWTNARMLTVRHDSFRKLDIVDVAHEALIRKWGRIQAWMAESRETARIIGILRQAALEWRKSDYNREYLFQGARLSQMESLLDTHSNDLTKLEIEFVNAGTKFQIKEEKEKENTRKRELKQAQALAEEQQKRAEEQAKAAKKLRNRFTAVAILAILSIIAVIIAVFNFNSAMHQKQLSEQRELIANKLLYSANLNLALKEWEKANIIQMQNLLNSLKPKPDQEDLRGFEWYYALKLANNEKLALYGHKKEVISAGFSFDGKKVASGSSDDTIKIWNAETGELLASNDNVHKLGVLSGVASMAFSPVENIFATAGDGDSMLKIWDFNTGKNIATYKLAEYESPSKLGALVHQMEFSPDGKTLALLIEPDQRDPVSGISTLMGVSWYTKLVDVATGKEKYKLDMKEIIPMNWTGKEKKKDYFSPDIKAIAFSPDGKTLAVGNSVSFFYRKYTVKLWDLNSGRNLKTLSMKRGWIGKIAFSPNSRMVAIGGNDIILWDINKSFDEIIPTGYAEPVKFFAFSPDGKILISTSNDRTLKVWDKSTYKQLANIKGHKHAINSIIFSPDGKQIVTASKDKTVKIWDLERNLKDADSIGSYSTFSPDGLTLATWDRWDSTYSIEMSGVVTLIHVPTWKEFASIKFFRPENVVFSPDSMFIAILDMGEIVIFDAISLKVLGTFDAGHGNLMGFSTDSKTLIIGDDKGTIRLVNTIDWKEQEAVKISEDNTAFLSFSPNYQILAVEMKTGIRLYDTTTWNTLGVLKDTEEHEDHKINIITFSTDCNTLASLNRKGTIRIWDIPTKKEKVIIKLHESDISKGNNIFDFSNTSNIIVLSPDTKMLATVNDSNRARIWDVKTGQELFTLEGHTEDISAVSFSYDSRRVATSSLDGTVKLWDTDTGQELITLYEKLGPILSVRFSPDGKTIITGYENEEMRRIKIWKSPLDKEIFHINLDDSSQALYQVAVLLAKKGKINESKIKFSKLLEETAPGLYFKPEDKAKEIAAQSLVQEGRKLSYMGKLSEAIATFQNALKLQPYLNLKPELEARRCYISTILPFLKEGKKIYEKSVLYRKKGERDKEFEELTKVINLLAKPIEKIHPTLSSVLIDAYIARGINNYQQGKYENSIIDLHEAFKMEEDWWTGKVIIDILIEQKKFGEAEQFLKAVKNTYLYSYFLAVIYLGRHEYYLSYQTLEKINPDDRNHLYYSLQFQILPLLSMNQRIADLFNQVKKDKSISEKLNLNNYYNIMHAYAKLGRIDKVREVACFVEKQLKKEPKAMEKVTELLHLLQNFSLEKEINPIDVEFDTNAILFLNFFKNKHQYDKAISILKKMIENSKNKGRTNSQAANLYLELCKIYKKRKQFYKLENLQKKLVKKFPSLPSVKNNFAYFLAQQNKKLGHALELSTVTLSKDEENPAYLDTYGYILLRMGRSSEAIKFLNKAYQKNPFDPEIIDHLAHYHRLKKEYQPIIEMYKIAIENDVDFKEQLIEKIKKIKNIP